jgi:hypothetical protein
LDHHGGLILLVVPIAVNIQEVPLEILVDIVREIRYDGTTPLDNVLLQGFVVDIDGASGINMLLCV